MAEEKKQEQQVEVVEEYVESTNKWTFLNYVKGIAHFKWWVIGFTFFGAVAGFLGFRFILNPYTNVLSATYTYDLAGTYTDSDTMSFIDGTLFSPYELTSRENLEKVKASNDKYASVDIDIIILDNAIVITKNAVVLNEFDATQNVDINYIISVKSKYFKNSDLGKDFVYDVINLAKELSTSAISNYESRLVFPENFHNHTFDRQITLLKDQYTLINETFDELINSFGSTAAGNINGTKLSELVTEFISQYYVSGVSTFTDVLTGQKDANKYVNYVVGQEEKEIEKIHELCTSYKETIKDNEKTIVIYEDRLTKLLSSTSIIGSNTNVSNQITELNNKITELKLNNLDFDKELNNNGYFLDGSGEYVFDELNTNTTIYKLTQKDPKWVADNATFNESIQDYKAGLINNNKTLTSIYRYCYAQYKNKINIQNGGYVTLSGDINSFIGAAAGLVIGFAISSLITFAVYVYKKESK